ncbi:MAG: NfeD family protein [Bacillota bacterium]
MGAWVFWLMFGTVLMLLEILTHGFLVMWFGLGALAAAVPAYLGAGFATQTLTFTVVSTIGVAATRRFAKRVLEGAVTRTAYEALPGKMARVIGTIPASTGIGLVKVLGEEWSALAETDRDILRGEQVEVLSVSGVHLVVRPLPTEKPKEES